MKDEARFVDGFGTTPRDLRREAERVVPIDETAARYLVAAARRIEQLEQQRSTRKRARAYRGAAAGAKRVESLAKKCDDALEQIATTLNRLADDAEQLAIDTRVDLADQRFDRVSGMTAEVLEGVLAAIALARDIHSPAFSKARIPTPRELDILHAAHQWAQAMLTTYQEGAT